MNISAPLYSRATSGLRNPQSRIPNKLVFVYPILFEKTTIKYANNFRDFLTALILKELFISNSINLITNVSKIHPLTDPNGNELDVTELVSTSSSSQDPYGMGMFQNNAAIRRSGNSSQSEAMKRELDVKIKDKIEYLKKILQNDPDYKPLRPMMNMITMDNMIDIPVIVGTKMYQLDSLVLTLLMVVVVSEKERISLSDKNDIDRAFNILKQLKTEDIWKLLNNIAMRPEEEKTAVQKWFLNKLTSQLQGLRNRYSRSRRERDEYRDQILQTGTQQQRQREIARRGARATRERYIVNPIRTFRDRYNAAGKPIEPESFTMDESFEILKITQNNINQTHLFFKFCVDQNLSYTQHGTNFEDQNIGEIFIKKKGEIELSFEEIHDNFMKMIGSYGRHVYTSFIYMFYPKGSSINPLNLMETVVAKNMNDNIAQNFIQKDFMQTVKASFSTSGHEDTQNKIKIFSNLCEKTLTDTKKIADRFASQLQRTHLQNMTFSRDSFIAYGDTLENISSDMMHHISRMEKSILSLIKGGQQVLNNIADIISNSFNEIYREMEQHFENRMVNGQEITGINTQIYSVYTTANNQPILNNRALFSEFVEDFSKWSKIYIYFLFLYNMQVGLCKMMSIIDVDIKLAGDNFLEFPNYTLVMPSQILVALANAIAAKSWREMVSRTGPNQRLVADLNDNYMKGIIKFMINKLNVPNIFVIDEQAKKVYYKLMHHTSVKNISLTAIDAYSKMIAEKDNRPQIQSGIY